MRILVSFLFFLSLSLTMTAKEIAVSKIGKISSIQEAVDVAQNGDIIRIRKGVYKENSITINNKSIQIIGENYPVIDGELKGTIFKIHADNFSIKGLKIINVGQSYTKDYAAMLISKSKHFTIEGNKLDKVFFGFLIEKSKHGVIKNNVVQSHAVTEASSGNGIHAWNCDSLIIHHNEVFGLRDGIYFEFVKNSKIYNNHSHNNVRYGLHFMFSNHNVYHHNKFVKNGAGVAVMFSKYIKMYSNNFMHSWGSASYGLLLKEIYDAEIENNTFEKNTIGVNAEGSTRVNYKNNKFIRNGWGVKIAGACYKNVFLKNDFLHNSFDLSYSGKLNENKFEGNHWSEYTGYDLDNDGVGDVAFRPVKLFSYVVNQTPESIILLRSLFVDIINFSEKVTPVFTPDNLADNKPSMKRIND